jgi:crossover junction endodeoxyribonuclease RusA
VIRLVLPWPPSVNTYWRHPTRGPLAGRHLISEKGRSYRDQVHAAVVEQLRRYPRLAQRLDVVLECAPPDRRQRDLDNLPKAVFDSLTHAHLWKDDSQLDAIAVLRREPVPGGRVVVTVRDAAPVQPLPEAA